MHSTPPPTSENEVSYRVPLVLGTVVVAVGAMIALAAGHQLWTAHLPHYSEPQQPHSLIALVTDIDPLDR